MVYLVKDKHIANITGAVNPNLTMILLTCVIYHCWNELYFYANYLPDKEESKAIFAAIRVLHLIDSLRDGFFSALTPFGQKECLHIFFKLFLNNNTLIINSLKNMKIMGNIFRTCNDRYIIQDSSVDNVTKHCPNNLS